MKCPECEKAGKRSRVYEGLSTVTCMAHQTFWDEGGAWHSHDPNISTQSLRCSEGHTWHVSRKSRCPAEGCSFNAEKRPA